jgi:hypothetical protein
MPIPEEDPNMLWLRHHIDQIFSNHHLTDNPVGPHRIAQIAALVTALIFLTLIFVMALTAPW